jgi:hypothetical protein
VARTDSRERGSRKLHLPDWPYGAVGRRRLLEELLLATPPEGGWTKAALEERADTRPGGIDGVLAGALEWHLVSRASDGLWRRPDIAPKIATPLSELLNLTRLAPDRPIAPLPKRTYRRSA